MNLINRATETNQQMVAHEKSVATMIVINGGEDDYANMLCGYNEDFGEQ